MADAMDVEETPEPAIVRHPLMPSSPVELPHIPELFYDRASFREYIETVPLCPQKPPIGTPRSAFVGALTKEDPLLPPNMANTAKGAIARRSTRSAFLDLLLELRLPRADGILAQRLDATWKDNAEDALRLIQNLRGFRTDKYIFYRCMGWLRQHHPRTALVNLDRLVRPITEKTPERTAKRKEEAERRAQESEEVFVEMKDARVPEDNVTRFDLHDGGAHDYYCDLLNILFLASKDTLKHDVDSWTEFNSPGMTRVPKEDRETLQKSAAHCAGRELRGTERNLLPTEQEKVRRVEGMNHKQTQQEEMERAKAQKHEKEKDDLNRVVRKLNEDPFYRALHITVARIFAEQIERDAKILEAGKNLSALSSAAKWAPSLEKMCDRATFIATTIAEFMFTPEAIGQEGQPRELYLEQARQHYRKLIASLRKPLDLVEIKISTKKSAEIAYNQVPSAAMDRHKTSLAGQDPEHPKAYLKDIAEGGTTVSGATLWPSLLVMRVRQAAEQARPAAVEARLAATKARLATNNARLAASNARLVAALARLVTSEPRLAASKAQMAATKARLVACKARLAVSKARLIGEAGRARQAHPPGIGEQIEETPQSIVLKVAGLQWKDLVQRIRDSGSLESAIAVVDTSVSMEYPEFPDETRPLDSAIGLGLLITQTTKPPFSNHFITFSRTPTIVECDPSESFANLVEEMLDHSTGFGTDFSQVFEGLLLPMAIANRVPRENMVKRIFVFSHMVTLLSH